MTEEEWQKCGVPAKMLAFIRGKASERKLWLFKTACCRRIWHLLTEGRSRKTIEAVDGRRGFLAAGFLRRGFTEAKPLRSCRFMKSSS
jgi:hypothetical protein